MKLVTDVKFEVIREKPYLRIDCANMPIEIGQFEDKLKLFIQTMIEVPGELMKLFESGKDLIEKVIEYGKDPDSLLKNANIDPFSFDGMKCIKNIAMNVKKVAQGGMRVKDLVMKMDEPVKVVADLCSNFKDIVSKADEVGKKARKENKLKLEEVATLHPRYGKPADGKPGETKAEEPKK